MRAERVGVVIALGSCAVASVGVALVVVATSRDVSRYSFWREAVILAVTYTAVGGWLAARRPGQRVAWTLLATGGAASLQLVTGQYGALALDEGGMLGALSAWVSALAQTAAVAGVVALVLLFPTGRLPSPRWRPVAFVTFLGFGLLAVAMGFGPPRMEDFGNVANPVYLPVLAALRPFLETAGGLVAAIGAVGCLVSLAVRFRRGRGAERQQIKWFLWCLVAAVGVLLLGDAVMLGLGDLSWVAGPASLAVAIGVAVVAHRLYDIDLIIRRSLAYLVLSVALVTVYVAVVTVVGALLPNRGTLPSLLAAGVIAVAFAPLLERVQRGVDRLLYGQRSHPYEVITTLGERVAASLPPSDVLPAVVESVATTLKLPFVAVEATDPGGTAMRVSHGTPPDDATSFSLTYQGEEVGHLLVGARPGEDDLAERDRALLADLARYIGVAARAATLTTALQTSRERLVNAREEERRRLRRDLHDGLGPALTAAGLRADAARSRLHSDPETATRLLVELRDEIKAALDDIRRLVYDLRPPALDELGLAGALREHALSLAHAAQTDRQLEVVVHIPEELPALPAAVEVAAYRIVSEAITNVARHASARKCLVRVRVGDDLEVEVQDDGRGLPAKWRAGVGVASIRERAAELGGSCTLGPVSGGGTRVHARLPLGVA